jgi:glycosyltransferase involved in cell wall biosynthesis
MLISVIVPVYNVEPYLCRCLDSLLAQTVIAEMEIILVDDGSTDGSGDICDSYASHYANINVVHQRNMGLSGARNSGIDIACGEYIGYVDSDDYVLPDMYETLLKNAEKSYADISCCGFI